MHHRCFARARVHVYWSAPVTTRWVRVEPGANTPSPVDGEAVVEVCEHGPGAPFLARIWRDAPGRGLLGYRLASGPDAGVIASSEIAWVLSSGAYQVHHTRLARALANLDRYDRGELDYLEGVRRVLPGHMLEIGHGGVSQEGWWKQEVMHLAYRGERSPLWPLEGQVRDFVEELDWAVERAIRGSEAKRVGLAVSSGLDSTLLAMRHQVARDRLDAGARRFLGTMSFPHTLQSDETDRTLAWIASATQEPLECCDMSDVGALGPRRTMAEEGDALGPPLHPGARYEAVFLRRFVEAKRLDEVWTGVGSDQLFDVHQREALLATLRHGEWASIATSPAWSPWLGVGGVPGFAARWLGRVVWRELAPEDVRGRRLRRQLEEMTSWFGDPEQLELDALAMSVLEAESCPHGEEAGRVFGFMESWEWEGLMRTLWRLERSIGVTLQVPYLAENLWRWRVREVSAARCVSEAGGRLFNKYVLRCAHALFHGEDFPPGFAWRGKAAVFDAHIQRGFMQGERDEVEQLIEAMAPVARERVRERWERVQLGEYGRPLVEVARACAAQAWRQRVDGCSLF